MEYMETVKRYFRAWLDKAPSVIPLVFESDAVYSECYGPEYRGLDQIKRWFDDWNTRGSVLEWTIKRYVRQENMLAVEWYFRCEYDRVIDGFDGVSIIVFSEQGKIQEIREFQSKAEHHLPYGEQ